MPLLLQPAHAIDLETARHAYAAGDYRTAYRGFKALANRDHAEAQYLLGLLYMDGVGVARDAQRGIDWLKRSAQNGSYLAAAELGQIYISGRGVAMDAAEAARWIRLSTRLAKPKETDPGCE